jgi:hypothetical protein
MRSPTKGLLLVVAAVIAIAGTSAPGDAKKKPHPALTPVPGISGGVAPGYYLMWGHTIVSPAYENLGQCYKDLAQYKQRLAPGSDTLVCVHRTH